MGVNVNHQSYSNQNNRPEDGVAVNESQYNIDETNESFSERKN